jgi:nucleoside-diphosphate-sugar epimerase
VNWGFDMQENLARPTLLITGSSGFLGQAIARGLQDRYRVIGFDLANPRRPLAGFRLADARLVEPLGRCTTSTFASLLPDRHAKRETE